MELLDRIFEERLGLKRFAVLIFALIFIFGLFLVYQYDNLLLILIAFLLCLSSISLYTLLNPQMSKSPLVSLGVVKECSTLECEKEIDIEFFKKAKKYIRLVSAGLEEGYFNDEVIRNAFNNVIQNGIEVSIAFQKVKGVETNLDFLNWGLARNINFFRIDDKVKVKKHLVIIDGRHIKVEKAHRIGQKLRRNCFYDDQPDYAVIGEKSFDKIVMEKSKRIKEAGDLI